MNRVRAWTGRIRGFLPIVALCVLSEYAAGLAREKERRAAFDRSLEAGSHDVR